MAAVHSEKYSPNELTHDYLHAYVEAAGISKTNSGANTPKLSELGLDGPPRLTRVTPNPAAHPIETKGTQPKSNQMTLLNEGAATSVDGVINNIGPDAVTVQLSVADGLEISLPPALVPEELLTYGKPVRILLDTSLGYRRAIVQGRVLSQPQERLPGEDALDQWLSRR